MSRIIFKGRRTVPAARKKTSPKKGRSNKRGKNKRRVFCRPGCKGKFRRSSRKGLRSRGRRAMNNK